MNRDREESEGSISPERELPDVQNIKQMLRVVFCYYTSYGDRMNIHYLKSAKFHKMMVDADIQNSQNGKKKLDLIFCSVTKSKNRMDFELFLNALPTISEMKYPGIYHSGVPGEALQTLLRRNLLALYDRITLSQEHTPSDIYKVKINSQKVLEILNSISAILFSLYKVHFPWEEQTSQLVEAVKDRSLKALFKFLAEFDISPSILNKSVVFQIWSSAIDSPSQIQIPEGKYNIGTVFTFSKFLELLVKVAFFSYPNIIAPNNPDLSACERLCLLLERMELSNGFNNLEKKTYRPHTAKTSLIPPVHILQKLTEARTGMMNRPRTTPESRVSPPDERGLSEETSQTHQRRYSRDNIQDGPRIDETDTARLANQSPAFIEDSYSGRSRDFMDRRGSEMLTYEGMLMLDMHTDKLHAIFQTYCSFGEPMNTTKLKGAKFMKMLKDSALVSSDYQPDLHTISIENKQVNIIPLKSAEADLIYAKIMGGQKSTQTGEIERQAAGKISSSFYQATRPRAGPVGTRMDFEQFLMSLKHIAGKVVIGLHIDQGLKIVIEEYILKLEKFLVAERGVSGDHIMKLMSILKDEEMVKILTLVHKSLLPYYLYYASPKALMNFNEFIRFCTDFSIFPDITSKTKLMRFFYTLANIYSTTMIENQGDSRVNQSTIHQEETDVIDEHLFIEAIALCAFEVVYGEQEPSSLEKIIYLLERMNQAKGADIVQKGHGNTRFVSGHNADMIYEIKLNFPHLFIIPQKHIKNPNFTQLLSGEN